MLEMVTLLCESGGGGGGVEPVHAPARTIIAAAPSRNLRMIPAYRREPVFEARTSEGGDMLFGMAHRPTSSWTPVAAVAAASVVFAHWLAYAVAIPRYSLRRTVLEATGHGYWVIAVKLAVVILATGLGALAIREWRARSEGQPSMGYTSVALRLVSLQVVGFLAMEIVERVAAGHAVSSILDQHLLPIALALQVLVACVGALLVCLLARATDVAWRRLRRRRPVRTIVLVLGASSPPPRPSLLLEGAGGVRGPPSS
jgi:hypothetical protein